MSDVPPAEPPAPQPGAAQPGAAQPAEQPRAEGSVPDGAVRVTLRRAPRFGPFILTGAVLGVLVGLVLSYLAPGQETPTELQFSGKTILQYFAAIGLLLGGLLGAAVAVLADRRRSR